MNKLTEITGIFRGERVRFDDVAICAVEEIATPDANGWLDFDAPPDTVVKLECEPGELAFGLSYRFYGRWTVHAHHGKQFLAQTFVRCEPHGRAGVIRYLLEAPNVGQVAAHALWQKFQGDAVRILRESPDVAVAAVKASYFSQEKANAAAVWLANESRLEACTIDMIDLLGGRGFPKSTAKKAIAAWGNKAAEILRRNPYAIMRFRGCGFLRADAMYLEFGGRPDSRKRLAYCCWHALAKNTEGHTWHPIQYVIENIQSKIGIKSAARIPAALKLAKRARAIAARRDEQGRLWVAEGKRAAAELRVAECVADAISENGGEWPLCEEEDGLTPHQAAEIEIATGSMTGHVGILGGSPGTGKTFAAAALIRVTIECYGDAAIAVCAPTGKAAVRVTEALQSYGVSLRAKTIHSLLKVAQHDSGDGWKFEHGERFPLPYQFVVVDEASMIDTGLMASLLSARAKGCHVLFVGNVNQLPPVGHGAPLRDMIAAGVPYGELTEIRRNSGTIVRACAQIRDGKRFGTDAAIDLGAEPPANLRLLECAEPAAQIQKMLAVIKAAAADGRHPVWDCQVVVPVNAKSKLSRKDLNKLLQRELNKTGQRGGGNPFLVGDKIVCLKNGFYPADMVRNDANRVAVETDEDGKLFVANGELAEVIESADKLTVARLLSPMRFVKIPRGNQAEEDDDDKHGRSGEDPAKEAANTGCQWDLAYALSCHKAQGSEFPVVVVMIDDYSGARLVCSREWAYTAISRAKQLCFLIGKRATIDGFCRRVALTKRKTFLKELIVEKIAEHRGNMETKVEEANASHA